MIERITVTVSEAYAGRAGEVAERLRAAGMTVERVLEALAIVTGTADGDQRASLQALDGVASVDVQQVYQLPDPDSGLQ
ncbi:hypothetical protein [Arthrobacter sp. JSM 101049]|uniref:hypothetical protein n=1 Tax=Arthrobacter sp. JSM 101049 TaxID=929097 RepID=UPI00356A8C9E